MAAEAAVHLVIRGRVQGVYYRAGAEKAARGLGLAGWVQNRPDGSVELWAEGGRSVLEELIAWCRRGPVLARVDTVDVDWPAPEGLASFDIR